MKYLPILVLFFSVSAFAYDDSYTQEDRDFERNEIRKARDRGATQDYGGYWMAPVPQSNVDVQGEVDAHRRSLEAGINYPY